MMSGKKTLVRRYIEGIGILVGMIFGAGVFALPYVTAQAGIAWGVFHLCLALFFMLLLYLLYGEITHATAGNHRFVGYVRQLSGKTSGVAAMLLVFFGYYGTLLIYGVLGGVFLSGAFGRLSASVWALVFFAGSGLLLLANLKQIGTVNFWLSIPLFLFVLVLAERAAPYITRANLSVGSSAAWFFPYGVFLFSLGGFATIPEARDIFRGVGFRHFRNVIVISLTFSAIFYALFTFSVVGVSGLSVSEDALSGLVPVLGSGILRYGAFIGFLAVFTSFLAMGIDLKNIFVHDFRRSLPVAWFLAAAPPVLVFLVGATNFIGIINIVGSIGMGLTGVLIIRMAVRFRIKKYRDAGALAFWQWPLMAALLVASALGITNAL